MTTLIMLNDNRLGGSVVDHKHDSEIDHADSASDDAHTATMMMMMMMMIIMMIMMMTVIHD